MQTTILPMVDGVRVAVPDKLTQCTSYVLAEQQDWFEEEIRFVRRWLMPGQKAIDIGAGLGVYTLAMAKRVGASGKIWSFEPYPGHSELLKSSIELNQFTNIVLERQALSDRVGTAEMDVNIQSERIALQRNDATPSFRTIEVNATTLDKAAITHLWQDIDFLKIDAEGEELAILRGGEAFLHRESPLVQFEVKHNTQQDLQAAQLLQSFGYTIYRYVSGLNVLVPIDILRPIDPFILNLFGCKQDRAERLAVQGLLLRPSDVAPELEAKVAKDSTSAGPHTYTQWLMKFPFAERLAKSWRRSIASGESQQLIDALNIYGIGRDFLRPPAERWAALNLANRRLGVLAQSQTVDVARCFTHARVALECGDRGVGLTQIAKAMHDYHNHRKLCLDAPFLPPASRYDNILPRDAIGSWLIVSATEAFELTRYFSSYFALKDSVPNLESIRDLGYSTEALNRRLALVQRLIQERDRSR